MKLLKFEFLSKIEFIVGTGAVWFWKWRGRRTKSDSKWNLDNHKSGKTFILTIITCSSLCWSSFHPSVFLCPTSIESIAQLQLTSDPVCNLYDTVVTIKTRLNYKCSVILFFKIFPFCSSFKWVILSYAPDDSKLSRLAAWFCSSNT